MLILIIIIALLLVLGRRSVIDIARGSGTYNYLYLMTIVVGIVFGLYSRSIMWFDRWFWNIYREHGVYRDRGIFEN